MMNVMVIGAAGMIGVYIVDDLISKSFNVIAVCHDEKKADAFKRKGVESYFIDISNKDDFKKLNVSNIDTVILLAGLLPAGMKGYYPERYFEVNTIGTLNVLEFCVKHKVKQIIFTQSHSDVSGYWGEDIIDPYVKPSINYKNDHTVYIISKIAAAELIEHYFQQYGLYYTMLRCPNIYAYHPDKYYYVNGDKKVVAYRQFIEKAINSEDIEIWGNPNMKRDIVYVKDLTQLVFLAIAKNIQKGIYNVANGTEVSLEQQVKDTISVFSPEDSPSRIIYRPDKIIPEIKYHYSIENAIDDLGYRPRYFHIEMLEDMKIEMNIKRFDFLRGSL